MRHKLITLWTLVASHLLPATAAWAQVTGSLAENGVRMEVKVAIATLQDGPPRLTVFLFPSQPAPDILSKIQAGDEMSWLHPPQGVQPTFGAVSIMAASPPLDLKQPGTSFFIKAFNLGPREPHSNFFTTIFKPAAQANASITGTIAEGQIITLTTKGTGTQGSRTVEWDLAIKTTILASKASVPQAPVSWRYRNEDEWLTREVLQEMAAWVQRARGPGSEPAVKFPAPSQEPQAQKIEIAFGTDTVSVDVPSGGEHVWSPEAFRPDTSALLTHFGLKAARPTKMPPSAMGPLTDPRISVLLSENQRISAWLAKEPLSPEAHEQAALLLGAFGLREATGSWTDTRSVMCAMAAHLALAQGLRQGAPLGTDGVYASLVIDTLAERQRPTLLALASLAARAQGPEHAWNNALTLRNNHDWRMLKDTKDPTLLERLEEFRAFIEARGAIQALEYLESGKPDPLPDWGLIAAIYRMPVQVGNMVAPPLVPSVQAQLAEVWKSVSGKPMPGVLPFSVLNEGGPTDQVLSWRMWSGRFRRSVLQAALITEHYYQDMLGAPDRAQSLRAWAEKELAPVPGFVLLRGEWELGRASRPASGVTDLMQACVAVGTFTQGRPEDVPAGTWGDFERRCQRWPIPREVLWFAHAVPRGTAYRASDRLRSGLFTSLKPEDKKLLFELPLCAYGLQGMVAPMPWTPAAFREACGKALDYNTVQLYALAQLEDVLKSTDLRTRERLCDLESDACLDLGERLAARRLDDQAFAAYQKAVDHPQDEVRLSGSLDFLVDYEFDHGHREKAEALARRAGDVGSAGGLETLGRFFERAGRYNEAVGAYRAIAQRYSDTVRLDSFYIRYLRRNGGDQYANQAQEAMKRLFPDGLQKVTLLDFKVPADATVLLQDPQNPGAIPPTLFPEIEQFGVRFGDAIMALDGYRVRDWAQVRCVRSFTDAPTMTVIVRRQGTLQEIKGNFRRLHYGPAVP